MSTLSIWLSHDLYELFEYMDWKNGAAFFLSIPTLKLEYSFSCNEATVLYRGCVRLMAGWLVGFSLSP
jgi:hypothetical protein